MAPWDELPYFDTPQGFSFLIPVFPPQIQLVAAEIRRVGLIIGCCGGGPVWVINNQAAAPNVGIQLNAGQQPFMLYHHDWPALVQQSWSAAATVVSNIFVMQILMAKYPEGGDQ